MGVIDNIIEAISGSGGDRDKAEGYLDDITGAYDGIEAPYLGDIDLQDYNYVGDVNPLTMMDPEKSTYTAVDPRLAETVLQKDSEMQGITGDPRLKEAQLAALAELQGIADAGGMNAADEANLSKILSQAAQADKGRRDAILQNMQRRGMGGSGAELLAQLDSSQASTDRSAQQGLDIAAMAEQRALDALMRSGELGGSIRAQDFSEDAQKAAAQDAINRFNASATNQGNQFNTSAENNMNMFNATNDLSNQQFNIRNAMDVNKYNVGTTNNAAYANRDAQQNVNNANTGITNQEIFQNTVSNPQTNFENKTKLASGKQSGAEVGADYWTKRAEDKDKNARDLIKGGATMATPYVMP